MTAQFENGQHRIVVGVDGSVPSKAALAWALRQARLTGAAVEAVIAWEFPSVATRALSTAVADVAAGAQHVKIATKVKRGNAAQMLLEEAAGADLLVVGSRGHGGFVEALLGSTGQHCVHHATCPVVVIRDSVTGRPAEPERG